MHLEWARPGVLRATAHAYEFASLVAAGRYVVESAPPDMPEEALADLRRILDDYDVQTTRLQNEHKDQNDVG
ncbi:hypothetical protein U9R90_16255 [Streptomyces sp. E11-3]|uniref:hypothetical protein n=1 Tax=Streptomyces sp. E11-3 TaxID=3110112 RepID=UPI00397EB49C